MTDSAVVDTDVISYLIKGHSKSKLYRHHLMGKILVISFMTYAELIRWALEANWGKNRQDRLEQYVRNYVIYPFDRALCIKWAEITDECRRKGITLGCADGWIAATAMQINIPLITNNAKDYQGIDGLTVITEIED